MNTQTETTKAKSNGGNKMTTKELDTLQTTPRQYKGITEYHCIQCTAESGKTGTFYIAAKCSRVPTSPVFNDLADLHNWTNCICRDAFRTYFNDYLTIPKWAEHNEIATDFAQAILTRGKEIDQGLQVSNGLLAFKA